MNHLTLGLGSLLLTRAHHRHQGFVGLITLSLEKIKTRHPFVLCMVLSHAAHWAMRHDAKQLV